MSALRIRIEELTERFNRNLPERIASIASSWEGVRRGGGDLAWRELTHRVHALSGTAATYGAHDVARYSRDAETMCNLALMMPLETCDIECVDELIRDMARMVRP
jgi:HPt (histidine-containing phosphotransfer) domain-containing protein